MKKIIISIGRKDMPINNFFIEISKALLKKDFKSILLVHGKTDYVDSELKGYDNITVISWPSIAPSLIRDIPFFAKLILEKSLIGLLQI